MLDTLYQKCVLNLARKKRKQIFNLSNVCEKCGQSSGQKSCFKELCVYVDVRLP